MATVKQIRRVFSAERVDTHWAFCEVIDLLKQLLLFVGLNDQGVFEFDIYPALLTLSKMNFKQDVQLSCDSEYTISQVTYSEGALKISVDYTQDLQARNCTLTIKFDSSIAVSPNTTIDFQAVSRTMPLIITKNPEIFKNQAFLFQMLTFLYLGMLGLSFSHKMIGAEVIVPFQVAYFSNIFYKKLSFFYVVTSTSGYIAGGWPFFGPTINHDLPFIRDRVAVSLGFLQNSIFIVGILALAFLLAVVLAVWTGITSKFQPFKKKEIQLSKPENIIVHLYRSLTFPVLASFLAAIVIQSFLNNLRIQSNENHTFPFIANSIALFFTITAAALLIIELFCANVDSKLLREMVGLNQAKNWYIPAYLGRLLLFSACILAGVFLKEVKLASYFVVGLFLLFFLAVLIFKPYQSRLFNISLLLGQLVCIYSISLPILFQFITIDQQLQIILIFVLQGLLGLNLILGIIRLGLIFWKGVKKCLKDGQQKLNLTEKKCKGVDEEENELKNLRCIETKKQIISPQKCSVGLLTIAHTSKLKIKEQEEEDNQILKKLKNKLRQDLLRKKKRLQTEHS